MVRLLRKTYFPKDYEVQFHKKRMNLRHKEMDISTHTNEFQKLAELECVKLARYMQGIRISIQDELILTSPTTINQCYQLALKVEEKFKRRNEQSSKGKGKNDR